jgi:alpha-galactosidase
MRDKKLDYDLMRRLTSEFARIAHYWLGDYYPLTSFATDGDVWMAWQFDVPEKGEGMVQAFRRAESPYCSAQFKLQGLDPAARYALTDLDVHDGPRTYTGRDLLEQGLAVGITNKPGAVVVTYKKLN